MISTKELFEGYMDCLKGASPKEIQKAKELYEYIVECGAKANYLNEGLDDKMNEGILSGLLGGISGAVLSTCLGSSICKVLGIEKNGVLGKLICSQLVAGALGYELAK